MAVTEDLRDVSAADVYVDDVQVATLTRTVDDDIVFAYRDGCRTAGPGTRDKSVSWSLLADGDYPVRSTGGAVPAFFAGLLPEGVRLGAALSSTKTSADDHLTLLLAVGGDAVGNVRVVPSGGGLPEPLPMFVPGEGVDLRRVFTSLAESVDADPVALAGIQPKVTAAMWSVPTRTPAGPAILKLTPPTGFPQLSENEHFFMRMAATCGLRVPETRLIHDNDGRSGLLVARFDRRGAARIAQEDACQVSGLYPASKYRMKAEAVVATLADACARGGGSRVAAVLELLRILVFSWVIGNGDLHGKNLSIHAPNGLWEPTPAYDRSPPSPTPVGAIRWH